MPPKPVIPGPLQFLLLVPLAFGWVSPYPLGWVPKHLGLLLEIQRLHAAYLVPPPVHQSATVDDAAADAGD